MVWQATSKSPGTVPDYYISHMNFNMSTHSINLQSAVSIPKINKNIKAVYNVLLKNRVRNSFKIKKYDHSVLKKQR